jgi:hypothetical protein
VERADDTSTPVEGDPSAQADGEAGKEGQS